MLRRYEWVTEQRGFYHIFYWQHSLEWWLPNVSKAFTWVQFPHLEHLFPKVPRVDLSIYVGNISLLTRFWKYTFVRFSLSVKGDDVIGMLVLRWVGLCLLLPWLNSRAMEPRTDKAKHRGSNRCPVKRKWSLSVGDPGWVNMETVLEGLRLR